MYTYLDRLPLNTFYTPPEFGWLLRVEADPATFCLKKNFRIPSSMSCAYASARGIVRGGRGVKWGTYAVQHPRKDTGHERASRGTKYTDPVTL